MEGKHHPRLEYIEQQLLRLEILHARHHDEQILSTGKLMGKALTGIVVGQIVKKCDKAPVRIGRDERGGPKNNKFS